MKYLFRNFGMLGLVVLSFGVVATIIDLSQRGGLSKFSTIHLVAGAVLVVLWFVMHGSAIKDMFFSRSTRQGAGTAFFVLLFAVIVVSVNVITITNPTLTKKWDFTEERVFSLSDQTIKLLSELNEKLEVLSFFAVGAKEREIMADLITRYRNYSTKIEERMIDADEDPTLAKDNEATNGVVVVKSGKNSTKIGDITEQDLTNAIIQVTKTENKQVYFLRGHDEGDLNDETAGGFVYIKKYIENEGYAIHELFLNKEEVVPKDCRVLVVLAPKSKFLPDELKKLELFLDQGGHGYFVLGAEYNHDHSGLIDVGLDPLFEKWGFTIDDNIVFYEQPLPDALKQLFGRQLVPSVTIDEFETHDIVKDFKRRVTFSYASSIKKSSRAPENMTITDLVIAKDEAYWGETNVVSVNDRTVEQDANDSKAPILIGLVAEKDAIVEEGQPKRNDKGTVLLISSSEWVSNRSIPDSNNPDLFLNSINWLAGETTKITIRPKQIRASKLSWTTEEASVIFYASVLILPELILLFGLAIWQWRKNR